MLPRNFSNNLFEVVFFGLSFLDPGCKASERLKSVHLSRHRYPGKCGRTTFTCTIRTRVISQDPNVHKEKHKSECRKGTHCRVSRYKLSFANDIFGRMKYIFLYVHSIRQLYRTLRCLTPMPTSMSISLQTGSAKISASTSQECRNVSPSR